MNNRSRVWTIAVLAAAMAVTTACTGINGGMTGRSRHSAPAPQPEATAPSTPGTPGALSGSNAGILNADDGRLSFVDLDGKSYVSAMKLAELLEFQTDWDPAAGKLSMGDNDVAYELTGGSREAVKEGNAVTLKETPRVSEGALYIPVDLLPDLFAEEIYYEVRGGEIVLRANPEGLDRSVMYQPPDPEGTNDELSFADDPDDPFKGEEAANGAMPNADKAVWAALPGYGEAVPALKDIDMNKLIATAKRYMGVKYKFGAAPYPQSGRFDCSTFTRYVFGKQGVSLPRLSRAQAREGVLVSRKMLRKGDLMFFYVPGRFKTNKTVGHVGIYMGNNKMIHSSPEPKNGVQISNINQAYWKKTFLRAKRVAS